jgi:saccharopine dehydrogenase-like NADP-dependent oxidoreductase
VWRSGEKRKRKGAIKNMKKVAVFGIGRMGTAISYAMSKLGYYVVGIDSSSDAANNFRYHIKQEEEGTFYNCDERDYKELLTQFEAVDVVISSLPYHQNQTLAEFCIDNDIRYCDLGGRVDVSNNINEYAKDHATKPIMTDLGLAPGWVNIMAEHGYSQIHRDVDSVKMMVGGLPACFDANPPFNYVCSWSTDGLVNEYRDDCKVLLNGEIHEERGMEGLEEVHFDLIGEDMEAFFTSGGASHTIETMKSRGVKNCSYKTLRYKGHCEAVRFLIRHAKVDDETLGAIFEKGCPPQPFGDVVFMKIIVKGGDIKYDKEILIPHGNTTGFTAMQRATAFPISSVAALMAEGIFDGDKDQHRDHYTQYPKNLAYSDIPYEDFNKNLEKLEISV